MAQYDVYVNPQRQSRQFVPFVVDVQSGLIDQLPTRLVLPLSRVGAVMTHLPLNLCPVVRIEGETLTIQPHLAAPVAANQLKTLVANLQSRSGDIAAALDAVLSGI
ncbi:CcdB family protein [Rhodoferax sp.]|uniref:CcdB family protein n=1 Tax=Rhodoferax sp. TaxID=50421 RepID=UPI001A0330F1|nr:CcdB family protein [Rhodoferax sp.]MBE0472818.1 CcdB family protein [Rhodoferax sp.]